MHQSQVGSVIDPDPGIIWTSVAQAIPYGDKFAFVDFSILKQYSGDSTHYWLANTKMVESCSKRGINTEILAVDLSEASLRVELRSSG